MRVVVTGGSGLVGRALVGELLEHGHRPVVLSRAPERVKGLPEGVAVEGWDCRSAEALAPLIDGADAVVHLLGENIASGRWTAERKRRIRASRVESTRAVAEAFGRVEGRPAVLAQGSAVGLYGPRGDEEVTEEASAGEDFLAEVCVEWERASEAVEGLGVRRPVLRTGVVLSRDGGALPKMALPFRLLAGGPVGSGRQWLPWIHIADQAGAIRFLLETESARGPFNLTAPNPLTNRDFGRALGRALGRPSLLPTPGFALKIALGEMAEILLEGQRAVPAALLAAGYRFRFPDAGEALRDLFG